MRTELLFAMAVVVATACTTTEAQEPGGAPTMDAVFSQVLEPRCTFSACHSAPTVAARLDLSRERACNALVNASSCLFPQRMLVVPSAPDDSFLMHKLTGTGLTEMPTSNCSGDSNAVMPFGASEIPEPELALVRDWISAGAPCEGGNDPDPVDSPQVISSVTASHLAPLAGELVKITIELIKPAPEGGQVIDLQTESRALSAPVRVFVAAGDTKVKLDAYAERPTSLFNLIATAGKSSKAIQLRVRGLEVSEVLGHAPGNAQWIKLRNTTALPIDLTRYRLQAGQSNYGLVTVPLTGTIAPGRCAVIGGPASSPVNGSPMFDQMVNFTPDLPAQGNNATGYAVFDTAAAMVGGVRPPVDTILVGANNNAQLLGADGQVAVPGCAAVPAGSSAQRTGAAQCMSSAPQPNQCP
jgi:hypothetical protein